jgi:hypothetical protein
MNKLIELSPLVGEAKIIVNPALIVTAEPKESRAKERFTILVMINGSGRYLVRDLPEAINQLSAAAGYTTRLMKFTKKGGEKFIWINPSLMIGAEQANVKNAEAPFTFCSVAGPSKITLLESPAHINNIIGYVLKKKKPSE